MNSHPIRMNSYIYKLLNNPFFQNIADNYLGSSSFLNFVRVMVSKAKHKKFYTEKQLHMSGNSFHFDYTFLRSLRFFLYLTDVFEESGPHNFIKSSHEENFKYPESINDFYKSGYRKYYNNTVEGLLKDEWVNKNFPKESHLKFVGKKGTLIIEDTTGFHKGGDCINGSREVLMLNYGISNIGCSNIFNLPVVAEEKYKNLKNNINYNLTKKCQEDNKKYLPFVKNISTMSKIKRKFLGRFKNYLI